MAFTKKTWGTGEGNGTPGSAQWQRIEDGLGDLVAATSAYTALTGTPQRGTFATGSVTTAQLAGVVMAIQADLLAKGIITSA